MKQLEAWTQNNPITEGETFKNYKDLCEHFGLPVESGKAKLEQKRCIECFLKFEKYEHSSMLVVTEVYNPHKPLIDGRQGIHTTLENQLMQDLLDIYVPKYKFNYRSAMLKDLGLISYDPPNESEDVSTAQQDYCTKMMNLFKSAVKQLNKKYDLGLNQNLLQIKEYHGTLVNGFDRGNEFTEVEEEQYKELQRRAAKELRFSNAWFALQSNKVHEYQKILNQYVEDEMKITDPIRRGYYYLPSESCTKKSEDERITEMESDSMQEKRNLICKELCQAVAKKICQNYEKKYPRKLKKRLEENRSLSKLANPKTYKSELNAYLQTINFDYSIDS